MQINTQYYLYINVLYIKYITIKSLCKYITIKSLCKYILIFQQHLQIF